MFCLKTLYFRIYFKYLVSTCEITDHVLNFQVAEPHTAMCSVPPALPRHPWRLPGTVPRAGASPVWGQTGGGGLVQPGEETSDALGRLT